MKLADPTEDGVGSHLSPEERVALGRAARRSVPRSSHAVFEPADDRPDPIDVIERQSASRVAELVPVRYGRMTESPFRFYRGAAAIMAGDLAGTPATGLTAQLCGDAHLLNFRLLASPERRLVFDINDFDETLPGPWEWDVKRLAASVAIAGRENGFDAAERRSAVLAAVGGYRNRMRYFAGLGNLAVWYAHADSEQLRDLAAQRLGRRGRQQATRAVEKARGRDNLQAFDKLTAVVAGGERRFTPDPPLVVPLADVVAGSARGAMEQSLRTLVRTYARSLPTDRRHLLRQYRVVDMARKVVGVGSVGTRCWIVLLLGKDDMDPLILQAKEADRSVLEVHTGRSGYDNQGHRVVAGQRLMQAVGDIFLGWDRVTGVDGVRRDFYVRQLHDGKGIAQPQQMDPHTLRVFAELCGGTLARAHARSGDRIAIAAYLGSGDVFDHALAQFAEAYADRNEKDHEALVREVRDGRVRARAA